MVLGFISARRRRISRLFVGETQSTLLMLTYWRRASGGGWITPTFSAFPVHSIEDVVMKLSLVALLSLVSGSAVGQVPQNPQACALLRADLEAAYNRFITSGESPATAIALVERMLEMRRKTGDPCYWPPPRPTR
jgi:hypothetical protein